MISANVCTRDKTVQLFKFDIDLKISEAILIILDEHEYYKNNLAFNKKLVKLNKCKIMCNGKSLKNNKNFEEYTIFQIKHDKPFKFDVIIHGGHKLRIRSMSTYCFDEHNNDNYNISKSCPSGEGEFIEWKNKNTTEQQIENLREHLAKLEVTAKILMDGIKMTKKLLNRM